MKASSRDPHPFETFSDAVKKFLKVPKATVEAQEKALREERAQDRKKKRATAV